MYLGIIRGDFSHDLQTVWTRKDSKGRHHRVICFREAGSVGHHIFGHGLAHCKGDQPSLLDVHHLALVPLLLHVVDLAAQRRNRALQRLATCTVIMVQFLHCTIINLEPILGKISVPDLLFTVRLGFAIPTNRCESVAQGGAGH